MDIRCHPNTLSNFFKYFTLTFQPFVIRFIFVNLVSATFETPSCQIERSRNPHGKVVCPPKPITRGKHKSEKANELNGAYLC